jgi:hypothetical protein
VITDLEKKVASVPDRTLDLTPAPCPVNTVQIRRGDGTVGTRRRTVLRSDAQGPRSVNADVR